MRNVVFAAGGEAFEEFQAFERIFNWPMSILSVSPRCVLSVRLCWSAVDMRAERVKTTCRYLSRVFTCWQTFNRLNDLTTVFN